jgi:hypothetical protein
MKSKTKFGTKFGTMFGGFEQRKCFLAHGNRAHAPSSSLLSIRACLQSPHANLRISLR